MSFNKDQTLGLVINMLSARGAVGAIMRHDMEESDWSLVKPHIVALARQLERDEQENDLQYVVVPEVVRGMPKSGMSESAQKTCFNKLCMRMGFEVAADCTNIGQVDQDVLAQLREQTKYKVGYTMYPSQPSRNHVVAVAPTKSVVVDMVVPEHGGFEDCCHGITSAQEFFNPGGRFALINFYAEPFASATSSTATARDAFRAGAVDASSDAGIPEFRPQGFGSDATRRPAFDDPAFAQSGDGRPRAPDSVSGVEVGFGGANVTGGVVRSKKRVIKSVTGYDRSSDVLRGYTVAGTTMFNNVDEMYLNVISRTYAQEIMEHLFRVWGVPDEPEAMRYAEDLLFAFLIARTASNKADYTVAYDIPTRAGEVEADFSKLSALLAAHYGLTRRNFSRALADDLRGYLRRPENQATRSRAAARIGADPQYGHLCFDGSTECSNMTTSEQKFTRVLEAKGLYEDEGLMGDGASSILMEGVHSGARSIVAR